MYKTVIFDLDGTLLNTLQDLAAAGNFVLGAMGLPQHTDEDYRSMVGNGIGNLVRLMLPEAHRKEATITLALSMFERRYAQHMSDLTAPYPGIPEMLSALAGRGVVMGVLSNKTDALVRPIVEEYFPGRFDAARGLRPGVPPKPDPTSALELLAELGGEHASTLYCGDSDTDMLTAARANLRSCGVLWGFRSHGELVAAGAGCLVSTVAELQDMILQEF